MMRKLILSLLVMVVTSAAAQCTFRNTAFQSGEFLTYNLYYNWKFVWVKAGTASYYTVATASIASTTTASTIGSRRPTTVVSMTC